jgi:hypothetical protein
MGCEQGFSDGDLVLVMTSRWRLAALANAASIAVGGVHGITLLRVIRAQTRPS